MDLCGGVQAPLCPMLGLVRHLSKATMTHTPKRPIYGNTPVYTPEGKMMFRCDQTKINWYKKKNLADDYKDGIKLFFVPKGPGVDPVLLKPRINHCYVCGKEENLTRHHIVPSRYRKWFPHKYKTHASEDVAPLCSPCHIGYENTAQDYSRKLNIDNGLAPHFYYHPNTELAHVSHYAHTLLLHGEKIPLIKRQKLTEKITAYLGHPPTKEDLHKCDELDIWQGTVRPPDPYRQLVDKIGIEPLIKLWRQHFVDCMQPKFLPNWWSVDMDYSDETRRNRPRE